MRMHCSDLMESGFLPAHKTSLLPRSPFAPDVPAQVEMDRWAEALKSRLQSHLQVPLATQLLDLHRNVSCASVHSQAAPLEEM
jgi:hypothetical protein